MREKYELLISLKLLEHEIKELTDYSKECSECFELLQNKLDYLCQFIISKENIKQWNLWGEHREIKENCEKLREVSIKALCDIEKYQSVSARENKLEISKYITSLSDCARYELKSFCINKKSKVLFIGSGAFPISALTIAKEIGAEVMCLDIDIEAINLGKEVAKVLGLDSIVSFSNQKLNELEYVKEASHIIIASLVKEKLEILEDLKDNVGTNTKIILRYGNGLKSVFNYPLDKDISEKWAKTIVNRNESIYDTIVLEKDII